MQISSYLSLVLILLFSSCNGNSVNQDKAKTNTTAQTAEKTIEFVNSLRIKKPHRADVFSYGEAIEIVINPKRKKTGIDSIQIFGDGVKFAVLKEKPWTLKWTPKKASMGKHSLKIMAYQEDGKIGLVNTYINIKSDVAPVKYSFEIVKSYPHDKSAYTQGLFFHDGYLYEGTGQHGESSLRKVKLENGEALSMLNLEQEYFGEGITYYQGKILQLTWNSGKAFVMDAETFDKTDTFYPQTNRRECWGITTMKDELVISDGSNALYFFDPNSYERKRVVEVYDNVGIVDSLNELEYIDGKIYANVWLTDRIVIINPTTGKVEGSLNLGSILTMSDKQKLRDGDDVLNGIAYDSANNRIFVTGKRWPKMFEIKLKEK